MAPESFRSYKFGGIWTSKRNCWCKNNAELKNYPEDIKKNNISGKLTTKQALHSTDATKNEEYEDESYTTCFSQWIGEELRNLKSDR